MQDGDEGGDTPGRGASVITRTKQGEQYAVQCRVPIRGADDWGPPTVEAGVPLDGEQVVFDTNAEAQGHDFFRVGGMDISKDGRWMLYGADTSGDERYDFRIRDLETGDELEERFEGIGDFAEAGAENHAQSGLGLGKGLFHGGERLFERFAEDHGVSFLLDDGRQPVMRATMGFGAATGWAVISKAFST